MFGINGYVFLAIVVIATTIIIITKLIIDTIKYAIKQKNENIKACIENDISYQKEEKQYNKKLKEVGITSKKERDTLLKILEALYK